MEELDIHSRSLLCYVIEWTPSPPLSVCKGRTREERLRVQAIKRTLTALKWLDTNIPWWREKANTEVLKNT
ncbi:hypothetical protein [Aeromonas jandaei]|uniref:hypothetical protein n=1 Tax=Aeromonas jandaei TaxID=650 RepID=UPI003B9E371E